MYCITKTPLLSEQKHTYHEPKYPGQGGGVNLAGSLPWNK